MQIVIYIGIAIMVFAQIWMLVRGFQESVLWGLGMFFLPIVTLFFLFAHWSRAKSPFLLNLLGLGLCILGVVLTDAPPAAATP